MNYTWILSNYIFQTYLFPWWSQLRIALTLYLYPLNRNTTLYLFSQYILKYSFSQCLKLFQFIEHIDIVVNHIIICLFVTSQLTIWSFLGNRLIVSFHKILPRTNSFAFQATLQKSLQKEKKKTLSNYYTNNPSIIAIQILFSQNRNSGNN